MNDMFGEMQYMGVDSHMPSKGWGYSVVAWNGMYEVCPFYDGDIPMGMDVLMCRDLKDVGEAIRLIMTGEYGRLMGEGENDACDHEEDNLIKENIEG